MDSEGHHTSKKEVAYGASDGDDADVATGVLEVVGIKGGWFAPAKSKATT